MRLGALGASRRKLRRVLPEDTFMCMTWRNARLWLSVAVLAACTDSIAPKSPSAANAFVKVVSTVSKPTINRGDTLTFTYSVENITNDSLTLTTPNGCQIRPVLDQVDGARMSPAPLTELSCLDNVVVTVRKLARGEKVASTLLLRSYDPSKSATSQVPGYLLTAGTFDASMLVTANEIGAPARSDWVRFVVK